jgi:hypothetical protein
VLYFLVLQTAGLILLTVNGRYDLAVKNTLVAAGGTGFTYPACSAPAYVSGTAYVAASTVSYNGCGNACQNSYSD